MIFPPAWQDVIELPDKPMKRDLIIEQADRFRGKLRHYHRSGGKFRRTWDDWVEGDLAKQRRNRNLLRMLGVTFSFMALGGIVIGLILELA